jgi:hypothetical protein
VVAGIHNDQQWEQKGDARCMVGVEELCDMFSEYSDCSSGLSEEIIVG